MEIIKHELHPKALVEIDEKWLAELQVQV